ncbi:histidine phosphatase family protein [bacterium]|nr:histidine phosphatase family protein [bacterium]
MIRLLFFRHPIPNEINFSNRISLYDSTQVHDPGVKRGSEKKIFEKLSKIKINFFICSPLKRCFQTAEIIGKRIGIKPIEFKSVKEVMPLKIPILENSFFKSKYIEKSLFYSISFVLQCIPWVPRFVPFLFKGESYVEVMLRIHEFVLETKELCREIEQPVVAIITHQAFISLLRIYAFFQPGWEIVSFNCDYSGCTELIIK